MATVRTICSSTHTTLGAVDQAGLTFDLKMDLKSALSAGQRIARAFAGLRGFAPRQRSHRFIAEYLLQRADCFSAAIK